MGIVQMKLHNFPIPLCPTILVKVVHTSLGLHVILMMNFQVVPIGQVVSLRLLYNVCYVATNSLFIWLVCLSGHRAGTRALETSLGVYRSITGNHLHSSILEEST